MSTFEIGTEVIHTLKNVCEREMRYNSSRPKIFEFPCVVIDHPNAVTKKNASFKSVRVRFSNGIEKNVNPSTLRKKEI